LNVKICQSYTHVNVTPRYLTTVESIRQSRTAHTSTEAEEIPSAKLFDLV